ncbi:MAG TPA: hypothetical protein VN922_24195 [Bacteroidia bacterium]|nr:hypothetical protein [Bacteroidia bacterium]
MQAGLFKTNLFFLHLWFMMRKTSLTFIILLFSLMAFGQKAEHYMENECDCFIYPGGNDTTKSFTPTHAQIDTAEAAIRLRIEMRNPPGNMRDLVRLGLDQFERHYHGTINKDGHKELRIHGVNKSNPDEVWVTYYDLTTNKLYNFTIYGSY